MSDTWSDLDRVHVWAVGLKCGHGGSGWVYRGHDVTAAINGREWASKEELATYLGTLMPPIEEVHDWAREFGCEQDAYGTWRYLGVDVDAIIWLVSTEDELESELDEIGVHEYVEALLEGAPDVDVEWDTDATMVFYWDGDEPSQIHIPEYWSCEGAHAALVGAGLIEEEG